MSESLLEIENLKTYFPIYQGVFFQRLKGLVKAVDGVTLSLKRGEVLGLVGESGCGKSTLGRTIMRLTQPSAGKVILDGIPIHEIRESELIKIRPRFQMIFQDPYASLNPRMTVFDTLAEPLLVHGLATGREVLAKVSELMDLVGLARRFIQKYPHEFSGGQRQRIAIARALALKPELLIADEPVSALDVSIQSQIINLLVDLKRKLNLAMIFISHDLSVIRYISDRVAVMYLGKIVETGPTSDLFEKPLHPYTRALLSAIPIADPDREHERKRVLLEGDPPSPTSPPTGCHFHPRCAYAKAACAASYPILEEQPEAPRREVACFRVRELDRK